MDPPGAAQTPRPWDAARWVELRVHGVSGTPPESILGSAFVTQVAGDDRGRFFRPADSAGAETQPVAGRVLEAYHWGRFTSGSWTQALWLLIIPFGVLNAASFTLSRPTGALGRAAAAVVAAALRVVGLAMTCLLVFASAEAALDLWAWQRQGAGAGNGLQWWSVAGVGLPVGAVVLFFFFGRTGTGGQDPASDRHNERPRAAAGPGADGRSGPAARSAAELADADFFAGDPDAPALRRLHCAAPLHMLAMLLLWPVADLGVGAAVAGRVAAVVLITVNLLVVLFLGDPRQVDAGTGWHTLAARVSRALFVLGIALLPLSAAVVALRSAPTSPAAAGEPYRGLPGIGVVAVGLLFTMLGALVVLLAGAAVLAASTAALPAATAPGRPWSTAAATPAGRRQVERAFGRFARGMTAWLLGSVAAFLAVGFSAAFAFAAQSLLTVGAGPRTVRVTPLLQRVAYAWGLTVVLIGGIAVITGVLYLARRHRFVAAARAAFARAAVPPAGLPADWVTRVGRGMYLARLKNAVPLLFTVFALVGLALSVVAGLEHQFGLDDGRHGPLVSALETTFGWLSGLSDDPLGGLVWLGTWTLTALATSLVVLGRGALRAEKARRGLNVVWDVVAFWPRRAHPFVPPPYSLHVVAGLRRRISWHLGTLDDATAQPPGRPADRLVVAAHSQGSLITVAALLWLSEAESRRVGLVTFGSQLQQQFTRAFPSAVDVDLLGWVWDRLGGRWRNLYRDTDPIAGPVLSWHHGAVAAGGPAAWFGGGGDPVVEPGSGRCEYGPEWRLLDPVRHDEGLMGGPMDHLRGHGDYQEDPSYAAAVAAVLPPPVVGGPADGAGPAPRVDRVPAPDVRRPVAGGR
jgi:hypothetical protein